MVKNQTILHPASLNLGKGDSRYVSTPFFLKHPVLSSTARELNPYWIPPN